MGDRHMEEPPKLLKDPTHVHQVNADFAYFINPIYYSPCVLMT